MQAVTGGRAGGHGVGGSNRPINRFCSANLAFYCPQSSKMAKLRTKLKRFLIVTTPRNYFGAITMSMKSAVLVWKRLDVESPVTECQCPK
jgi:hypothetical protein